MSRPILPFGKHKGLPLSVVVLRDPDWVFWAGEKGLLGSVRGAAEIVLRAQNIRIPDGPDGPRVADYILNHSGLLDRVEVDYPANMIRDEDRDVVRQPVLDLSFARAMAGGKDKTGARAALGAVRRYVFRRRGWGTITAERAAEFFADESNFLLAGTPTGDGREEGEDE